MWICDRRLYRIKNGKIVEEGDPRATGGAVLVASPGMEFPEKPVIDKVGSKAVEPAEDKAKRPAENKANGRAQHAVPLQKSGHDETVPVAPKDNGAPPPPMPELNDEDDGEED